MESGFKVLLTDSYDNATVALATALRRNNAQVYLCSKNGAELLEKYKEIQPDVIIADAFLQHIDAIGVLSRINTTDPVTHPLFAVLLEIENLSYQKVLLLNGADYIFVKPVDPTVTAERIRQMLSWRGVEIRKPCKVDLNAEITEILDDVGIPVNVKGYKYLREAIRLAVLNPKILDSVMEELYPAVARRFESTPVKVERDIRYSLGIAWQVKGNEKRDSYFKNIQKTKNCKPSNSRFIAVIADKIILKKGASYYTEVKAQEK